MTRRERSSTHATSSDEFEFATNRPCGAFRRIPTFSSATMHGPRVAPSPAEILVQLVALFCVSLPLGAAVLRVVERVLGRPFSITVVERLVVSFYVAGAVLFVFASIPVPWYGLSSVAFLLAAGAAVYAIFALRDRAGGLLSVARFFRTGLGVSLLLGSLALLSVEILGVWNIPLSDPWDGGMAALWTNLTLARHTLPWTLEPYANWGVTYSLAPEVWMTLPALLFGWPIGAIPLWLTPLFLSLTIPAAYCWGIRLGAPSTREGVLLGPLFAAFFGVLASWPRLFVGGGYDFAFALPLLLLLLGWARPFVEGPARPWKEVFCFGLLGGVLTALSPVAGEFLVLTLVGYWVVFRTSVSGSLASGLARLVLVAVVCGVFLTRSLVGFVAWYSYPGHVLQAAGSPPFGAVRMRYQFSARLVTGELDPFVPWKAKLSPFPVLALELQVLLAIGLILLIAVFLLRSQRIAAVLPRRATETLAAGTVVAFLFTGILVVLLVPRDPLAGAEYLTSLDDASVLLFLFLSLVALLPLASALLTLDRWRLENHPDEPRWPSEDSSVVRPRRARNPAVPRSRRVITAGLVLLIAVPLGSGAVVTAWEVPQYLHTTTLATGNVTSADVDALEWVGANLPPCSRVLVAPGSAGQFLPEYAHVGMVFPMIPVAVNLTYVTLVKELINGMYNASVRSSLLELNITEIFGTGVTFTGYSAFNLTSILRAPAPDFSVEFDEGDASILAFTPGVDALACPP